MFNVTDARAKVSIIKNLITTQTYQHIHKLLNSTNVVYNATEGLGRAASESSIVLIGAGGFNDQKITCDMKYVSPTAAGSEDFGAILRCQTTHSTAPNMIDFYWARVVAGQARIAKSIGGSFSTLSSTTWALAQNTVVTITFSVVGSNLTATFQAAGGSPGNVTLVATDTAIPTAGLIGFRSFNSSFYCRNFTAEQL